MCGVWRWRGGLSCDVREMMVLVAVLVQGKYLERNLARKTSRNSNGGKRQKIQRKEIEMEEIE